MSKHSDISRRDVLKLSGLALGTTLLAGCSAAGASGVPVVGAASPSSTTPPSDQQDTLFDSLPPYYPGTETLGADEMRISFMGSSVIPRLAQACNSVFVELGNGDSFVFDCGAGVILKYTAMQIPMSKMSRIFLTHLHGDHTSDLTYFYCFGCQEDRKSPLYIWGPSASGVPDPVDGTLYDDGTVNFCRLFREMNRWHTESQSFVATRYSGAEGDGYDIAATELNWRTGESTVCWSTNPSIMKPGPAPWIAYRNNGVTISFFPAVHDRNGSVSYKLEWNGRSMIFTGDTRPTNYLIKAATGGVDVLISEMVVPPEVWTVKMSGISDPANPGYQLALKNAQAVQENSHTPEKALGYLLSQLWKRPRLAVATHFQAENDTNTEALNNIRLWYDGPVTIAADLMVINVTGSSVKVRRAVVSNFAWYPLPADPRSGHTYDPKYSDTSDTNPYSPMAPYAQLDPSLLAQVIDQSLYNARQQT
jgi:ribonuclease Z